MDKLFSFVDEKHSFIAGFSCVLSINAVLIVMLLLAHYLVNLIGHGTIGFSYLLLYVFNLSILGKHTYILIGLYFTKSKINRMDISALLTSLVCSVLVACLAISKFDLFNQDFTNNQIFTISVIFICISFCYSVFFIAQTVSGINLTTDSTKLNSQNVLIDKKLLNKIKISFLAFSLITMILSITLKNVIM